MPVSRGLRRLLQLRHLVEEQNRIALDTALAELHRLERAFETARERSRCGRQLVHRGARTGDSIDRIAGIEEDRAALRQTTELQACILQSRDASDALRIKYQSARVERRQVETLIGEAEAAEALDTDRRTQQALDERYGSRHQVGMTAANRANRRDAGKTLEDKSTVES